MWIFCIPCIINNNSLSNNRHLHLNCVVVIVDHTRFLLTWFPDSLSSSASASVTSYSDVDSDDTIILQRSPASTKREEDSPLAKVSSADFITAFVWKFKQTWKCSDKWQMNESCEIMIISVFLHLIFFIITSTKMIEDILKNKPGGERIMNEYARTKSLTDARRRDMVKILVAQMTSDHGYVFIKS